MNMRQNVFGAKRKRKKRKKKMSDITISESELIYMLEKAFDEGYFGYLETKKDYVRILISDYISNVKTDINLVYGSFSNDLTYSHDIITNSVAHI